MWTFSSFKNIGVAKKERRKKLVKNSFDKIIDKKALI